LFCSFYDLLIIVILPGDPLYVSGGQPKCFHPELMDESFEKDGYEIGLLFVGIHFN